MATSRVRICGRIRNGSSTRRRTMNPAAFEPTERYAVTGGRRALVNIRYPNMKRDGGDFETECDNDEDTAEKSGVVLKAGPRKYRRNFLEIGFAGCAKDPGDPVN